MDRVARAIIGGEPADVDELADARGAALDVLELLAGLKAFDGTEVKLPYETPRLTYLGRLPSLELHVVPSRNRRGQLSLRVDADSETWDPVFEAMNAAGFKAGDVVRLTKVGGGDL